MRARIADGSGRLVIHLTQTYAAMLQLLVGKRCTTVSWIYRIRFIAKSFNVDHGSYDYIRLVPRRDYRQRSRKTRMVRKYSNQDDKDDEIVKPTIGQYVIKMYRHCGSPTFIFPDILKFSSLQRTRFLYIEEKLRALQYYQIR